MLEVAVFMAGAPENWKSCTHNAWLLLGPPPRLSPDPTPGSMCAQCGLSAGSALAHACGWSSLFGKERVVNMVSFDLNWAGNRVRQA